MTYAQGGAHHFEIGDEVKWQGIPAKVLALTVEPSVTVQFLGGGRLTVGQSVLERAEKEGANHEVVV